MSYLPTIALHLGVHKTATTYLQSRLQNSIEILKENGIGHIPLVSLRRAVTTRLDDEQFSTQQLLDLFQPYLSCERLILSDENLIGGTFKPNSELIYEDAGRRLKKLLSLLGEFHVELFITLRNYPDYFVSRYTESLRHYRFFSFEQYYKSVDFESVTWLDVIASLKEAGAGSIIVSDFGDIFADEQDYFYPLFQKENIVLNAATDNPTIRRSKLSKEAYDVVKCYGNRYSKHSINKLMNLLDNARQESPATAFMPFTDQQIQAFSERYAHELVLLKSNRVSTCAMKF